MPGEDETGAVIVATDAGSDEAASLAEPVGGKAARDGAKPASDVELAPADATARSDETEAVVVATDAGRSDEAASHVEPVGGKAARDGAKPASDVELATADVTERSREAEPHGERVLSQGKRVRRATAGADSMTVETVLVLKQCGRPAAGSRKAVAKAVPTVKRATADGKSIMVQDAPDVTRSLRLSVRRAVGGGAGATAGSAVAEPDIAKGLRKSTRVCKKKTRGYKAHAQMRSLCDGDGDDESGEAKVEPRVKRPRKAKAV